MSENLNQLNNEVVAAAYGFADDTVKLSTYHFGGNFGKTFITKFEFTNMAGKKVNDVPTEGEALDILFNINGTERNMRIYPVTKAYDSENNNTEITDPTSPVFKAAVNEVNQICIQIMKCFVSENDLKAALARRISSFKEFVGILINMLPKNFKETPLDIFMQYQYAIKADNTMTYLEIPKKTKYGCFICKAVPATKTWTEIKNEKELFYLDCTKEELEANPSLVNTATRHPHFSRSEWFVGSPFANQQRVDAASVLATATDSGSTTSTGGSSSW
jgi:hypothetical protein